MMGGLLRATIYVSEISKALRALKKQGILKLAFGPQFGISGDEGDRTPDLGVANAALSHLSYIPTNRSPSISNPKLAVN